MSLGKKVLHFNLKCSKNFSDSEHILNLFLIVQLADKADKPSSITNIKVTALFDALFSEKKKDCCFQ